MCHHLNSRIFYYIVWTINISYHNSYYNLLYSKCLCWLEKFYAYFTLNKRESIYILLKLNKNISKIAKEIERNKSSVSREIKDINKETEKYNVFKV